MKTSVFYFISCMLLIATNGFAQKNNMVKGDGNIVTKKIAISDYDGIAYVGSVDIEYEQSNSSPYLKIKVDKNILPNLEIKVKGKTLIIQPKEKGYPNGLSLQPTVCEIKTNSRELKEINAVGSGKFIATSPLKVDKLGVGMAGSCTINFSKLLEARKVEFSVAGSGNLNAAKLKVDNLESSVAGSGTIVLTGEVERGYMSVAGGGDIKAFGCTVRKAECNVAGGGNIEVYASEQLDASTSGSGRILYKGDPELSKSVVGGGSIKEY